MVEFYDNPTVTVVFLRKLLTCWTFSFSERYCVMCMHVLITFLVYFHNVLMYMYV